MFYICWGKKSFQRPEGIAADFCAICRRAVGVEVRQIRSQNHVYHVGIGQGELVGRLCRCLTCGSQWALQAGTIQTSVIPPSPTVHLSLETLIAETFPRLSLIHADRLQQEEAVAQDPFALDEQTRLNLIAEPFFILENDVREAEDKTGSWQTILGGVGCLGAIGFTLTTVIAFAIGSTLWACGWLLVSVALGWLTFSLYGAATRRFMRERIYGRLASCLAPLRPAPEELAAVLEQIQGQSKYAFKTDLKHFLPILNEAAARSAPQPVTPQRPASDTMPAR